MWRGGGEQRQPVLLSSSAPSPPFPAPGCRAVQRRLHHRGLEGRGCLTPPSRGYLGYFGEPCRSRTGSGLRAPRREKCVCKMAAPRWPRHHGCRRLGAASGRCSAPWHRDLAPTEACVCLQVMGGDGKTVSRPRVWLGLLCPEGIVLLCLERSAGVLGALLRGCSGKQFSLPLRNVRLEVLRLVVVFKPTSCLTDCSSSLLMAI